MKRLFLTLEVLLSLFASLGSPANNALAVRLLDDVNPPAKPVKLIFIHHSTGGNWLADPNNDQPYGGLGRALMENNYFVSATNYGWGPDSIGDRTDIVNWPEWFLGPDRDTYMDALYNETGQNVGDFGDWSRMTPDPGGENVIIMFKSCFPNSDLYGNPDDVSLGEPNDYDYTVANAKAVYNALLVYFETRQDKLFIIVTAPPLMRSETARDRAANARAFNNWLVNDWLRDYPYPNVGVFDYYNVLTDPDNHHRWNGSVLEHIRDVDTDFSAYPSGDSHPSTEGHTKATGEFVPLLNIYYNRWQAGGATALPLPTAEAAEPTSAPAEATESLPETVVASPTTSGVVDDFEREVEWYADIGEGASIVCSRDTEMVYGGAATLHIAYTIPAGGWGGCGRYFDVVQDWSEGTGLVLWLRTDEVDRWVTLTLFAGNPDNPTPFEIGLEASTEWTQITILWDAMTRAAWADESGLVEFDPARITSLGFSLGEGEGHLWVDDVALITDEVSSVPNPTAQSEVTPPTVEKTVALESLTGTPAAEDDTEETADSIASNGEGMCASAPLVLLWVIVVIVLMHYRTMIFHI
ncbi:MAG: hypothetical protein JXA33_29715 [Anaerolineae bacterium]|nr:hypothetical protein [Anaerolineae bacterium]